MHSLQSEPQSSQHVVEKLCAMSKQRSRVVDVGSQERREVNLKFLVVGAYGVGKTSIMHRYVNHTFHDTYRSTIGIDFHRKTLVWNPNCLVNLQLWDVAGNEKFRCMTTAYYRNANGVAIVIDVSRPGTLANAQDWLDGIRSRIDSPDGTKFPVVLMANKGDLEPALVSNEAIVKFCEANDVHAWCTTSARLNENIDHAFDYLIDQAMSFNIVLGDEPSAIEDSIRLGTNRPADKKDNCCGI